MNFLKQSTASQTRSIGAFVDDTDFKTVENGLTIANTDIKLKKNGATAVNKNSGGATSDVNGMYAVTFDATDSNTVGELEVSIDATGALVVWKTFFVLEEVVYDALFASSAPGYLQPTTAGRTLDVTATGAAGIDWANIEGQGATVGLSGTTVGATTANADMRGTDSALLAANAPTNFSDLSITPSTGRVDVGEWLGTAVTTSSTTSKPEVDVFSMADVAGNASNLDRPISLAIDLNENRIATHAFQGDYHYVGPTTGNDTTGDGSRANPWATIGKAHTEATDHNNDVIIVIADDLTGQTSADEQLTITKSCLTIMGPGDCLLWETTSTGDLVTIAANDVTILNMEMKTHTTGSGSCISITGDSNVIDNISCTRSRKDGVVIENGSSRNRITDCLFDGVGAAGAAAGVRVNGTSSLSEFNLIRNNAIFNTTGDGVVINGSMAADNAVLGNDISQSSLFGVSITANAATTTIKGNTLALNTSGPTSDNGVDTFYIESDVRGYVDGSVWVDTIGGTAGTNLFINGTITNPCISIEDAKTIANALNLEMFNILPGSSFTFVSTFQNFRFLGEGYTVALGGQDISGSRFNNCTVSGIATATARPLFRSCLMLSVTLPSCAIIDSAISGTVTLNNDLTSTYRFTTSRFNSGSAVDFTTATNNSVTASGMDGEVDIRNLGNAGTDTLLITGNIDITLEASCVGGTAKFIGIGELSDSSTSVSIDQNAYLSRDTISDTTWDELTAGHTTAGTFGKAVLDILVDTGTDIPALIAALNDISAAQVNAEMLDVLTVDTFAEPSSVPAATSSLADKIAYNFTKTRNKSTQTATTYTLRDDADSGDIATATVSDDGATFTKGEDT